MPRLASYDPILSGRVAAFLTGLTKAKQKKIIRLIFQLADYPAQVGDYTTQDATGRRLENILLADWNFTFWADHAAREFRITDIAEI